MPKTTSKTHPEAYIIDAVRTPVGRRGGGLAQMHPADLGAIPIKELLNRTQVDPLAIDDVMWGCVDAIGPQAGDIGRTCWLVAGLPEEIPGTTIDRQCGSGQQAVHFAAQAVMSGVNDLVVAGGVQNMSQIPIGSAMSVAEHVGITDESPFHGSPGWTARYGTGEVSQFWGAEEIAKRWDLSRQQMEEFALTSHQRAITATDEGRFDTQIIPIGEVAADEGPRRDTSAEKMAQLQPLVEDGRLTAAVSSQISDGAAALLIASGQAVKDHNLSPMARVHHMSVRGANPMIMLTGPIPATKYAFEKTGMSPDDIDLFECNEAFAPVVLAWMNDCHIPHEQVNVNGGAIALGHPLGCTGARIMTTLLHEMQRTGARFGLQTMCEGGGQANVTILELLDN